MVMVETNVVQSRFKFNENIGFKVSLERLADIELIDVYIIQPTQCQLNLQTRFYNTDTYRPNAIYLLGLSGMAPFLLKQF